MPSSSLRDAMKERGNMKVYLYELDSVRNTAAEIELAQKRLFEETVGNGNTVVLSLNQLLDGMGFTGALYGDKGDENYQTILKLFQSGLVKVCKFTNPYTKEEVETLTKYWINNMEREHFIVSGIEISPERKADMKAVLTGEKNISILALWDDTGTEKEAQYVQRVVNLIIELDYRVKNLWVEEEKGAVSVKLSELLDSFIVKGKTEPSLAAYQNVKKSLDFLMEAEQELKKEDKKEAEENKKPSHYRSNWYKKLETHGDNKDVKTAKRIVDLCYNIAIESGITGVSVEYETYQRIDESGEPLQEQRPLPLEASEIRLNQYQYLIREIDKSAKQRGEELSLPPWGDALEVIQEAKFADKGKAMEKEPFPLPRKWKKTILAQKKNWNKKLNKAIGIRFGYMLLCAAIFMIVICCIDPRIEPFARQIMNVDTENSIWFSFKLYMTVYVITYALDYVVRFGLKKSKLFTNEEDVVQTAIKMLVLIYRRIEIKTYLCGMTIPTMKKDADQP